MSVPFRVVIMKMLRARAKEITRLRDENAKLVAALQEIIIHCDWPDRVEKYARAALKEGE